MTPPQNRKRNTPTTPRPTLRTVTLEAFKSVQAATIELGQLTVLVGPNSSGKSTLIDSLMMRSQTKLDDPQGTRVDLNGEYIRLGAVSDIVNVNIDTNGFSTGGTLTIHPDQLKLLIRGRLGMLGPSRGRQQVADSRSASTDLQPHLHTLASDHYFVRALRELLRLTYTPNDPGATVRPLAKLPDTAIHVGWEVVTDQSMNSYQTNYGRALSGRITLRDNSGATLASIEGPFRQANTDFDLWRPHKEFVHSQDLYQRRGTGTIPVLNPSLHDGSDAAGELLLPSVLTAPARILNLDARGGLPSRCVLDLPASHEIATTLFATWTERARPSFRRGITRQFRHPETQELMEVATDTSLPDWMGNSTLETWKDDWPNNLPFAREKLLTQATHWTKTYLEILDQYLPVLDEEPTRRQLLSEPSHFFRAFELYPLDNWESCYEDLSSEIWNEIASIGTQPDSDKDESLDQDEPDPFESSPARFGWQPDNYSPPDACPYLLDALADLTSSGRDYEFGALALTAVEPLDAPNEIRSITINGTVNEFFETLSSWISNFVANHIFYVGPLREPPQPAYINIPSNPRYVGLRGEFTASAIARYVYDVDVLSPRLDGNHRKEPLHEALNYWLGEQGGLGLVHGVVSMNEGATGHRLEVHPIGHPAGETVSITAVGTGVSQVLPVVVQGLLTPPGSVLVLQQPELHLHPALQLRLGDFLLALSKSGRQIILETHSEHLVSRLARRVVESDEVAELVRLKLVQRTDDEGTVYEDAQIDEFGSIQWPEGFFDETSDEAIAILRAGLEKMERSQNPSEEDDGPGSD